MKIALIGDIHANLHALQAVLNHAQFQGVQMVINTGDYLGYGPFPEETIQLIKTCEIVSVIGNYDQKVLSLAKKIKKWKKKTREEKLKSFHWAYDQLSEESKQYLLSLPTIQTFMLEGKHVLLTHGSPDNIEEHLRESTSLERYQQLADNTNANIIIFGHSHEPFAKKINQTWFINPGSVGRPDDGDQRASYALLQIQPHYFRIKHFRVEYSIEKTIQALKEKNLPTIFTEMIRKGRSMDFLNGEQKKNKETAERDNPKQQNLSQDQQIEMGRQWTKHLVPNLLQHCEQVSFLSILLFDQLKDLHRLDNQARFWLNMAGLLHDIGWIKGQIKHHKTALNLILKNKDILPNFQDRRMVALIARYHRKACPQIKHQHFRDLSSEEQDVIRKASSIIRLADGLDWEHVSNTKKLTCQIKDQNLTITCLVKKKIPSEINRTLQKGKYFEEIFNKTISIIQSID